MASADLGEKRAQWPVTEVRYLAFEGGGGLGFAHLGALVALADLGYLRQVEKAYYMASTGGVDYVINPQRTTQIAGTSAGGIIALLLSSEKGIRQMYHLIASSTPDGVVEPRDVTPNLSILETALLAEETWGVRAMPTIRGCEETVIENPNEELWGWLHYVPGPVAWLQKVFGLETEPSALTMIVNGVSRVMGTVASRHPIFSPYRKPIQIVAGDGATYLRNLLREYGAASGCDARNLFDLLSVREEEWLGRVVEELWNDASVPLTFDVHQRTYSVELIVVGTDLRTGEPGLFSASETGQFLVADAVRLSMAIPYVYKPTVIEGRERPGIWIDGGLTNNYPIGVLGAARRSSGGRDQSVDDHALGFRLVNEPDPEPIRSLWGFREAITRSRREASTNSQITTQKAEQRTVDLPTEGLHRAEFGPKPDVLKDALVASAAATYWYFRAESDKNSVWERARMNVTAMIEENGPLPGSPTKGTP